MSLTLDAGQPKMFDLGELLGPKRPGRKDWGGPSDSEGGPRSPFPDPGVAPIPQGGTAYDEQAICNAMRWVLDRESRARLVHEQNWAKSWELYNGRYAIFSKKAAWQSKKSMPRVFSAVHRIGAMLTQYLTTTRNWFSILADNSKQALYMDFLKDILQYYLDHPDINFELIFSDAITTGCLSQLMPLVITMDTATTTPTLREYGTSYEGSPSSNMFMEALIGTPFKGMPNRKKRTVPRIELVDPFRIYKDSSGRDRYIIRTYRYTRGEFAEEAKRIGFQYVEEIMASAAGRNSAMESPYVDEIQVRNRDTQGGMVMDERDYVHLEVLWGDLYDERGECLFRNSYAILANQRYLAYGPVPIKDAHGRPPIIAPALVRVPFSPYGKSLIGVATDSIELWTEFVNLLVDYFQKMVLGMVEIDEHLLEGSSNPRVLYPGKVFVRSQDADPAQPTIRPVNFAEPSVQLWNFLSTIQNEWNEGTAMASGMSGQQKSRGRVSAQEYSKRSADSGVLINYVFKGIEQTFLEPFLYMLLMNVLQYLPDDEWDRLVDERASLIEGQDADTLRTDLMSKSSEWRLENLGFGIRFKVRVFSAISDRQAELEKATILMNMLKNDPVSLSHLKRWPFLRRLFESLGWDPEEYISKGPAQPQDSLNPMMVQQWQQQLEQMLAAIKQTAQPGATPGGGGAGISPPQVSAPPGQPQGLLGGGTPMPGPGNPLAAILGGAPSAAPQPKTPQAPSAPNYGAMLGAMPTQ